MGNRIWAMENVLLTLKSFVVSIITALIMFIPVVLATILISKDMILFGRLLQVLSLVGYFWVWGWIANKFWDWE